MPAFRTSSAGTGGGGAGAAPGALPQPPVRTSVDGELRTTLVCSSQPVGAGGASLPGMVYEGAAPGPTLRLRPGDTLRLELVNQLEPSADTGMGMGMAGMDPATTNLHTHGLHVSPEGASDNVFLAVGQGQTQAYEIAIGADHWGGLNWYHPHHHGTVSPQVLGGMAGALIITGPLDEVPEVAAAGDQVLVLQRLQEAGPMIARMAAMHDNAFLSASGNPVFTVNGVANPTTAMRPSQLARWRILNADPIDYFDLALVDESGSAVPGALHVLAYDGITLPAARTIDSQLMVPGNRLDVLVQAPPAAGRVRLVGRAVEGFGQPDITFAAVEVSGDPSPMPLPPALPAQLPPIDAAQVVQRRVARYGSWGGAMVVNGRNYNDGPDEMELRLGQVEEWTIENLSDQAHAFHIHTNPFYVVAVNGQPLAQPTYFDTYPVPAATGPGSPGSITVLFRATEFTGRMVQHCHILPHEDAGMMGVVTLV